MSTFKATLIGNVLSVGFGDPGSNDQIVKDANARLCELKESGEIVGGILLKINGPASLPCAFVISHHVDHFFGAIGVFDPKLQKYVICVSHDPDYELGDLID
jgi:CRISPR-associated protein Csx3